LCNVINRELDKVNTWFEVNRLSLNVKKTQFMVFSNRRLLSEPEICINNIDLDRVKVTKFLGVKIDESLNWKEHIATVKSKIARNIAILYKASKLLNSNTLFTLYCTLILPYFSYCIENWGNTYKTNIQPLFILQKRAIRIICKKEYRAHTAKLFRKMGILKLEDLILWKTAILMWKANNNKLPQNILCKIVTLHTIPYNTRNVSKFKLQYVRTKQKQMCISTQGIKIWNSLDKTITGATTIGKFKKQLKAQLIAKY
jgi:hypothetical protein